MKTTPRNLFLLALSLLLVSPCAGQPNPNFTYLSEKDPVNNTFVLSVIQAYSGHYYLATAGELFRFDGYTHKRWTYDPDDPNGLSNQVMWSLAQTPDSMIWIGTDNGLNALDPRTERITRFYHQPKDPNSPSGNSIWELFVDEEGTLWIGTDNGFSRFAPDNRQFERICYQADQDARKEVYAFLPAASGEEMWVGVGSDLLLFHPQTGTQFSLAIPGSGNPGEEEDYTIRCLLRDRAGMIWVGTGNRGIFRFDPTRQVFTDQITDTEGLRNTRIRALHQDEEGYIWVGTYGGGLHFIDPATHEVYPFETDPFNPVHENFDIVYTIFEDPAGNIWAGTFYGGPKIVRAAQKPFRQYVPVPGKPGSIPKVSFGAFTERPDGTILIADKKNGYLLFDPVLETFSHHNIQLGARRLDYPPEVRNFAFDKKGNLWGIGRRSMVVLRPGATTWEQFLPKGLPPNGWITNQFIDPKGRHWIATQEGLYQFDASKETLRSISLPGLQQQTKVGNNQHVLSICMTRDGSLWFNTQGGVNRLEPGQDSMHFYPAPASIFDTHQAVNDHFYFGSNIGLGRLDAANDTILFDLPIRETLVWAFLDDENGRFWMSGDLSLHSFDPVSGVVHSYNEADGISVGKFFGHHLKDRDGQFYYAGNKGILRFDPLEVNENSIAPRPVIAQIRLLNKPLPIRGSPGDSAKLASPLLQAPAFAKNMTLKHWQNDVSFTFAAVEITSPENNQFAYRLHPQDEDWVYTSAKQRIATYTNLRPGKYTFEVKASNNDGLWSTDQASIDLHILPPWYWNPHAWSAYVLLFAALIILLNRMLLDRQKAQLEAQASQERYQQLEQHNAAKNRIFANLSHEFRTPLTAILGTTSLMERQPKVWNTIGPARIRRSARDLLNLVEQMLGLSRLEAGSMPVKWFKGDVTPFLEYLCEPFAVQADMKGVELTYDWPDEELVMDYDPEKMQVIVSNVLSNALKYTPENGQIRVSVTSQNGEAILTVMDSGVGIPEEHLPHIFDRFYQVETDRVSEGTGIGLAYTKELVNLLAGRISAGKSSLGGAAFTVVLPIHTWSIARHHIPISSDIAYRALPDIPLSDHTDEDLPLLLIVEDHPVVSEYLEHTLAGVYQISVANNGAAGRDMARESIPDIILSDVMMPEMDGYQLCQLIKKDERTCHIPVVLLTARADESSRLQGMREGADAYLSKPVSEEELHTCLANLLENRQRIQAHYISSGFRQKEPVDPFLHRALQVVRENLQDESFGIDVFCEEMTVSRTQLHRKLKALTGLATSKFIRRERIEKAKELLRETDESISQIAFACGFLQIPTFNRAFREWTGSSPTEYRKSVKSTS